MNKHIYSNFISDVQTFKTNLTDYVDKAVAGSYDMGPKSQNVGKCKNLIHSMTELEIFAFIHTTNGNTF